MAEKKPKIKREEPDSQLKDPAKVKSSAQEVIFRDDDLPDGWKAYVSKSSKPGSTYYFNAKSGVKSWTLPTSSCAKSSKVGPRRDKHGHINKEHKKIQRTQNKNRKLDNAGRKNKHYVGKKSNCFQPEEISKNKVPVSSHAASKTVVKQEPLLSVKLEAEPQIAAKRKSAEPIGFGQCKKMHLDQPMVIETTDTPQQNPDEDNLRDGFSVPCNLNNWLHSHSEDEHVESMDWESTDIKVLASVGLSELSHCWHVVVDTNVLLDNLEFVHQLRDMQNRKFGQVVVAIPWAALRELDRFKSENSSKPILREPAKRAISFIHKSFSMSHPHFIGHFSLAEDIKPSRVTNDDSIILYCLTLKSESKNVILLTEDKNMCNKAITAQLNCYSVSDFKRWIELSSNNGVEEVKPVEKSDDSTLPNDVPAGVVVKCAKKSMTKFLGKVLEAEMKSIYNELWSKVVLKRPPWSFEDILRCYDKHWVAVLTSLFRKPAHDLVKKMLKTPAFNYSQTFELIRKAEVQEALYLCLELCSCLKEMKYKPYSLQAIEQLKPLKEQLESGERTESSIQDVASSSSSTLCETKESDKISLCFNSALQSINDFCYELNHLDGPHDQQLLVVIRKKFSTYHRIVKSLVQLNGKLLQAQDKCATVDLQDMSALLLEVYSLQEQNLKIETIRSEALKEFYAAYREALVQSQDLLTKSSAIISSGMSKLMMVSHCQPNSTYQGN